MQNTHDDAANRAGGTASPYLQAACEMVEKIDSRGSNLEWFFGEIGHLNLNKPEDMIELRSLIRYWMTSAGADVARAVRFADEETTKRRATPPALVHVVIGSTADLETCAHLFPDRLAVRIGDQVDCNWGTALLLNPMQSRTESWWLEKAVATGFWPNTHADAIRCWGPTPAPAGQPTAIVVVFQPEDLDVVAREHGHGAWVTLWGGEWPTWPLCSITAYGVAEDPQQLAWLSSLVAHAAPDVQVTHRHVVGKQPEPAPEPVEVGSAVTVVWRAWDLQDHLEGRLSLAGDVRLWGFAPTGQRFAAVAIFGEPDTEAQQEWYTATLLTRLAPGVCVGVIERQDTMPSKPPAPSRPVLVDVGD